MMKRVYIYAIVLISHSIGCNTPSSNHTLHQNNSVLGKWYYTDLPDSYIEIYDSHCIEHIGQSNLKVRYKINWIDSLHYELEVVNRDRRISARLKVGDKVNIRVIEVTADYYQFYLEFKGERQCILMTRNPHYDVSNVDSCR